MISQRQRSCHPDHRLTRDKRDSTKKPMKDLSSCFSSHAVRAADVGCSRNSSIISRSSSVGPNNQSNRRSVMSTYVSRLTSKQEILIHLTWWRNNDGPVLTVRMDDQFYNNSHKKMSSRAIAIQLSREKKGNWTFTCGAYTADVSWDVALAVYNTSPEPISGYYVAVNVNSESVLLLGDITKDHLDQSDRHVMTPQPQTCMISWKEQVQGLTSYTTKARFHPGDKDHKICIKYEEDNQVLLISVDDKLKVHVTRLKWHFRGNQTVFLEEMMVDIMWNLHGWLYEEEHGPRAARSAWFMFRARSSLDEWLWQVKDVTMSRSSIFTIEAFKGQN